MRKGTRSPRRSQNCAPWSRGRREGTLGLAAPTFSARRRRASSGHWPPAPNSPVSGACPRLPLAESPASPGCGRRLHGKLAARSHLRSSGPTKWLIGRPLKSPSRDLPPDPAQSLSCFRAPFCVALWLAAQLDSLVPIRTSSSGPLEGLIFFLYAIHFSLASLCFCHFCGI